MGSAQRKRSKAVLSQNFVAILNSPVRKSDTEPIKYIQDRVNAVLAAESPATRDALRSQYREDFMSYLACSANEPTLDLLGAAPDSLARSLDNRMMTALNMSTATAVGSLTAMQQFLNELGTEIWFSNWLRIVPDPLSPVTLMNDPVLAAASTGKIDVMRCLLPLIKRAMGRDAYYDQHWPIKTRVYAAINAAIKGKHVSIIRILCNFARSHGWKVTNNDYPFRSRNLRYGELWINDAAATGCFHTCRAVLIELSALSPEPRQHWAENLFICACKHGSAGLLRTMYRRKMAGNQATRLLGGSYRTLMVPEYSIYIAACHGHVGVVDVLLEHGANIDDALVSAVQHGRIVLMKHLLRHGAHFTDKLSKKVQNDIRVNYFGLRSVKHRYQVLSYYLAAKFTVGKWPATKNDKKTKWLIEDVENSAIWGAKARELMEM